MQGQRGTVGSLPESFSFDHGSSSSNTALDTQIFRNNMRNQAEIELQDYILPGDTNATYMNPVGNERQNMNSWGIGEPSSSNTQQEVSHGEWKVQSGWSSSANACAGTGSGQGQRSEARRFESTSVLSLDNVNGNPLFMPSANSGMIPQGLNLNDAIVGHGDDDCQVIERHNLYKSIVPENEQHPPPAGGSDPFFLHPGHGGFLVEDDDMRAGSSLEGRRVSCKRKAVEGQSSASGSGSYFQHFESSVWPPVLAQSNMGTGLSISTPSAQLNRRLGVGARRVSSVNQPDGGRMVNAEGSQRNFRVRINPSNQQDPISATSFSTSNAVRHTRRSSSSHESRLTPANHSLDFRSAMPIVIDDMNPQNQAAAIQVPGLPQNDQSFRWNGSSSSRTANSSNSSIPVSREEAWARNSPRHILEHPNSVPASAPELRGLARNPTNRNLSGRNTGVTGDVASSTSRNASSSGVHPSPAPSLVPDSNPPRHPRRLSDYVRRSLFSPFSSEPIGQSSNNSVHAGLLAATQNMAHPSGAGNLGHHHPYLRLPSWAERQGDGVLGFPHPLRNLPPGSEGRRRLASEIRNALDLMRRGEGLRFEDFMIFDQSVIFGVADIHDRHRDMRLDVDNMSYEELLALEERIGDVCTGLSEGTIQSRLKQRKYSHADAQTEAAEEPCCVCQEEYKKGEDLGTLDCGHDFHRECIKQWLMQKNICPICKTTGLST